MSIIKQTDADPASGLQLLQLLMQQYHVLKRLAELTNKQSPLIADNCITELLELLLEKQRVVDDLSFVQSQLAPFSVLDAQQRHWPDVESRRAAQTAAKLCDELLLRISSCESADQEALQSNRDRLAEQLSSFHQAAGAYRAYKDDHVLPQSEHDFGLS